MRIWACVLTKNILSIKVLVCVSKDMKEFGFSEIFQRAHIILPRFYL